MFLTNNEINLILTWSANCFITNLIGVGTITITDTNPYGPVAALSSQDNAKLLRQLKSGFNRIISLPILKSFN